MALVVENGTGKADAEAYADVAFADAYHAKFGNTSWASEELGDRELALRRGARFLDMTFAHHGQTTTTTQALAYPRIGLLDQNGNAVSSTTIHERIQQANCEAALRDLTATNGLIPDIASASVKRVSKKLGPMAKTVEYSGSHDEKSPAFFTIISKLMWPFARISNGVNVEVGRS